MSIENQTPCDQGVSRNMLWIFGVSKYGDSIKLVENGFGHANGQGAMEYEVVKKVTKKSDLNNFFGPKPSRRPK